MIQRLLREVGDLFGAPSDPDAALDDDANHAGVRRRSITVTGRIVAIQRRPRSDGVRTLVADVDQDPRRGELCPYPRVRLVWSGRGHINGIEPGRYVRATGVETQKNGRVCIVAPVYELLTAPRVSPDEGAPSAH